MRTYLFILPMSKDLVLPGLSRSFEGRPSLAHEIFKLAVNDHVECSNALLHLGGPSELGVPEHLGRWAIELDLAIIVHFRLSLVN